LKRCIKTQIRWNREQVSRSSPDIADIFCPSPAKKPYADVLLLLFIFLNPQYKIPEGKILKTKQVRPQRRLLGGESAVERDRITPSESH